MKKLLIILIAIAVVGGGTMFYLNDTKTEAKSSKAPSAEDISTMSIDTDIITTNLASEDNYAVVQFNIMLGSVKAKEATDKRHPQVRAAVISTVAGFTKEQLVGKEGISLLEKELALKLNEIVQEGKVERVLVTEFKLQ